jgi:hypothetical protein
MSDTIRFTNMSDFLRASPFDAAFDLYPERLTPEVFYENLYVESEATKRLLNRLHETMFNAVQPNRVVFLKGFAGNGKTTFLHTFMRQYPSYRHVYCDFQGLRSTEVPAAGEEGEPASDEIKLLMNRYLRGLDGIDETFRFIYANRDVLKDDDFISFRLHDYLSAKPTERDETAYLRSWMDRFDYKDIFTTLFMHLFRQSRRGHRTIVYFDNLDIPRMEYVADHFLVYFQDAIACALQASRHHLFQDPQVDFPNDYRFVFCMRDANEAILNAHLAERIGFARATLPLAFDAQSFAAIAERRIQYMERHLPENDVTPDGSKWSSLFTEILHDGYFKHVFLPLFNYNYRELAGALVDVIHRYQMTQEDARRDFQMRGFLMFGLVNRLLERDFLNAYWKTRNDLRNGYCYIDRVLLTVLINTTNYKRRVDDSGEGDESEPYGLLFLVKDLQRLYDVRVILGSIARCFLFHKASRIHLLTVLNTKINDPEEFVRTYTNYIETADSSDDSVGTIRTRNDARAVLLKVNPAGFTTVRYILPHFEFYSNLVRNKESLFHRPLDHEPDGKKYVFESKIDNVFELVEDHVTAMTLFFDRKYTAMRDMTPATFASSPYCFRHHSTFRVAQPAGYSHGVKIITAHRDYLDRFRLDIINRRGLDEATAREINELLVRRIHKYVQLLDSVLDRDVGRSFAEQFERQIGIIEKSGFTDRRTRIALERGTAKEERE